MRIPGHSGRVRVTTTAVSGRVVVWMAAMGVVMACAVSEPPSGGAEDRDAPRVRGTSPARDSAGVAPDTPVMIAFDEAMRREGIESLIDFAPPIEVDDVRWDGNTVSIYAYGGLHPDTTYLVTLRAGVTDRHGVATRGEWQFAFATSASIDTGTVVGSVTYRREPSKRARVRAFVLSGDTAINPVVERASREVSCDEKGLYRLRYLPARETRFLIWAYEDANEDGLYDSDREHGALYPDTIMLTSTAPAAQRVDIGIIDPNEPAKVEGIVVDRSGVDSVRVSVGFFAASDTLAPSYYALCDSVGAFSLSRVRMGMYHVVAFKDIHPDSLCKTYPCGPDLDRHCPEPCAAWPDSVRVEAGGAVTLPTLSLERATR